jgi:type I restriction enzyme S subunit
VSGWSVTTLGELCDQGGGDIQTGPFGSQLHASDYVSSGVPSVMPINIGDNFIDPADIARISLTDAERLARYLLRSGDIVYSRRGDVEKRALVRPENEGWLCGTGCLRVRLGDGSAANSAFVSYALGTSESREWIVKHAVGATMPNLNTSILRALPIAVPPTDEQKAIGEVLGALDDKIAVNARVHGASAELKAALVAAALAQSSHEVQLGRVTSVLSRGITPTYVSEGGVLVLNQKCIRNVRVDVTPGRRTDPSTVRTDKLLIPNAVLINSTGYGTLGRLARWAEAAEATVDSHLTIVRFDSGLVDPAVAGQSLLRLQSTIEEMAEGSTGQTELSRSRLANLKLPVPTAEAQRALGPALRKLDSLEYSHVQENGVLAGLRDSLLPQLMSGKLRVRDSEKHVEAVV